MRVAIPSVRQAPSPWPRLNLAEEAQVRQAVLHSLDAHLEARQADAVRVADQRAMLFLRQARLHPVLHERVVPIFRRGTYSAAVFQALLEVEDRVRAVSGLTDLSGVDLMKQALRPGGKLATKGASKGDQEAEMALFWGVLGTFRNDLGHHVHDEDPQNALALILLASWMLDRVDTR